MRKSILFALSAACLAGGAAFALAAQQPYAGLQSRAIKALSDEEIAGLRAGEGMGFALAAELNGYPGPRHVIELAAPLGLTGDQFADMQALFSAMRAETAGLGERLIAEEAALDRQFAGRTVTLASLEESTQAIGATTAKLRAAHLKYHLSTVAILTAAQVARYNELRGYAGGGMDGHPHGGHPGGHGHGEGHGGEPQPN